MVGDLERYDESICWYGGDSEISFCLDDLGRYGGDSELSCLDAFGRYGGERGLCGGDLWRFLGDLGGGSVLVEGPKEGCGFSGPLVVVWFLIMSGPEVGGDASLGCLE